MIELLIVMSSFFSLCGLRRLFSRPVPSSYFLAPAASMSEIWLLGAPANWFVLSLFLGGLVGMEEHDAQPLLKKSSCVIFECERMIFSVSQLKKAAGCASGRSNTRIGSCWVFFGGSLVGNHVGRHDAQPLLIRSPCVIVLRANAQLFLSVLLRMAVELGSLMGMSLPKT